jgi:hypothetical protein
MGNIITTMPTNNSLAYEVMFEPLIEEIKVNALPFNYYVGKIGRDIYLKSPAVYEPTLKTTCGWTYATGNGFVKKNLNPAELDFSLSQCYSVLLKSIYGDALPNGAKKGDLTQVPEVLDFITREQLNNANTQMLTALFMSDKTSSTAWLSGIDGVFAKLSAGVANVDGTVDAGSITSTDLLPANIEATMNKIYQAQSELLFRQPDSAKAFIVTASIGRAWRRYLQIGTGLQDGTPDRASILNGVSDLSYNGIPIIELSLLDSAIATYDSTGSPASTVSPNRAILTIPSNHAVVLDGEGFMEIEPRYDPDADLLKSNLSAMIDYTYAFGDLNVIAGF